MKGKSAVELAQAELRAWRQLVSKRTELGRLEETAALELASDGSFGGAADQVMRLGAEIRLAEAAIRGLRAQRAAALAEELRQRAAWLRRDADGQRKELDKHKSRVKALMGELAKIEEAEVVENLVTTTETRSERLAREIFALEAKAGEMDQRAANPPDSGRAEAASVDELIEAVVASAGECLIPPLEDVEAWARGCEEAMRRTDPALEAEPRRYLLVWARGQIVPAESFLAISVKHFRPTGAGAVYAP